MLMGTPENAKTTVIERLESNVRSYCRSFPAVFARAEGSVMYDTDGRPYIDFFAGAGALNYGHNEPLVRERMLAYIRDGGIGHTLDMTTQAKCAFIEAFERTILIPRELSYKLMFTGPTGTNAVEAAIKLARKVTGRRSVIAFTNAFHGMTLGSLSLTGNRSQRRGAGVGLHDVARMPYDGYLGPDVDTMGYLDRVLDDPSSGIDLPAAIIVETVQAEGGINVASIGWLNRLQAIARRHGALLIVDDIQIGCGRTVPFFSFERSDVVPDIVCLSKSLSASGLPFALTLLRPELDQWAPGEHNGTFRGNNLAFVSGTAALERYWSDDKLERETTEKSARVREKLGGLAEAYGATTRGLGLMQGLVFDRQPELARAVSRSAYERGLLIETAGAHDQVLKLMPALTIDDATLEAGLAIIEDSLRALS